MLEKNIYDLLDDWDEAMFYEDKKWERDVGGKIEVLRKAYREGSTMKKDVKIVGVFGGSLCSVYTNNCFIAHIWNLKYTGLGSDCDNMRMYSNGDTHIWLDYAVYE